MFPGLNSIGDRIGQPFVDGLSIVIQAGRRTAAPAPREAGSRDTRSASGHGRCLVGACQSTINLKRRPVPPYATARRRGRMAPCQPMH